MKPKRKTILKNNIRRLKYRFDVLDQKELNKMISMEELGEMGEITKELNKLGIYYPKGN